MTLTISLPLDMEKKLRARAAATGKDVDTFVREVIEEKLHTPQTFDEICAPIREEFEKSGMTDEELAALVEEIREEIWQEKQARKGQ